MGRKREIVAAKIGSIITNNPTTIINAARENEISEFIERDKARLMAACDFGSSWEELSNGPILFSVDEAGRINKHF